MKVWDTGGTLRSQLEGTIAFLDFYLQSKVQAAFAKDSGLAPGYTAATEQVDPSARKDMVTAPDNLQKTIEIDQRYWGTNYAPHLSEYTKCQNNSRGRQS
jgi:hypothetical protein